MTAHRKELSFLLSERARSGSGPVNYIGAGDKIAFFDKNQKYLYVGNNILNNSNEIKTNPESFGKLASTDSVVIYQSSEVAVCGSQLTGSSGTVGTVDPSNAAVTSAPTCQ